MYAFIIHKYCRLHILTEGAVGWRRYIKMCLLLGWTKGQWLSNGGGHCVDKGHGVGYHVVPLRVRPGILTTQLAVSQTLVAPDMVDGVKLS